MASRIFFGNPSTSARNIALSPVVVEVLLATPNVGYNLPITLAPVVVEVLLVTPDVDITSPIEITLAPVVVEAVLVTPDIDRTFFIDLTPVVVEVTLVNPVITIANPSATGITAAIFETPAGVQSGGPVEAILHWETNRYLNRVGTWTVEIPVGDSLVATIDRGWFVSLVQENTRPLDRLDLEFLLYRGIVEDKTYRIDESGVAVCRLSGSFRGLQLVARNTPTVASYAGSTLTAAAEDIVDSLGGGITCPADGDTRLITFSFNAEGEGHEVVGRYNRLLRLGEYARWALRESWEEDAFEFVSLDAPPDSGYVMVNAEAAANGSSPGMALIGGTPEIRRDGHGIVNRIIPFGSDKVLRIDVQAETTLALAEYRMGVDPGGGYVQLTPVDPPFIQIDVQPTAGKTLIVAGATYTFTAGATAAINTIGIGADVAAARLATVAAVNGTDAFNDAHETIQLMAFGDSGMTANRARIVLLDPGTLETTTVPTSGTWTDDAGNESDVGDLGQAYEEVDVPLTLEHATLTSPYSVVMGTNDDGSSYWYLEDTTSQTRHGLVEMAMHRTDVKNPNADNDTTRTQAANVLHQLATLELHRHRAPKLYVSLPVANGDQVWALPGDKIRVVYSGNVLMDGEVTLWQEIDRWFLVIERHEKSSDSGVREVSFVLATPDVADVVVGEIPEDADVPVSPADDAFAVTSDDALPQILTSLGVPSDGLPGFGGSLLPPCCEDSTTITDLDPPESEPPPAPEDPLEWISTAEQIRGWGELSSWVPDESHVLIVFAQNDDVAPGIAPPALVSSGITSTSLNLFPNLRDLSNSVDVYDTVRSWVLEYDSGVASWSIDFDTPPDYGRFWVVRLTANKAIPNGITITQDADYDTDTGTGAYTVTLNASATVASADDKDATVAFNIVGSSAVSISSDFEFNYNGVAYTSQSKRIGRNIGATATPTTLELTYADGGQSNPPNYHHLALQVVNVRLNDE
jgi:hypothetical protein